jgi:hypothetical protein
MLHQPHQAPQVNFNQNLDSSLPPDLQHAIHILQAYNITPSQARVLQQHSTSQFFDSNDQDHRPFQLENMNHNQSSPTIKLAFNAVKYFSLFLLGTGIAFVVSASLKATGVISILSLLFSQVFVPAIAVTFCIVAAAIILESFK